ncbi:MAG: hypothetical protein IJH07_05505 [Ruminococcus sp.]|nr:hypothetical protein [Ruminococcus sp.]
MDRKPVYIDRDVQVQLKMLCVQKGVTIGEYVSDLVRKALEREKENE